MKKKSKHRSDTREAVRRLIKIQHGLIDEISQLRKYVLAMYGMYQREHQVMPSNGHSVTDSIDSPQP